MERSNPNDRADEPSDDDGQGYPLAPLPKHERQWRHPSEMGQQAWVMSEPPIALGRGLLVTTGAIGCALGLAILWMLLPVGGGAPVADPMVTRSSDASPVRRPGELAVSTTSAAVAADLVTSIPERSLGSAAPPVTSTAEAAPSGTVMLHAAGPVEEAAIAVLVMDASGASRMITTANAVGDDTELSVMLDSGDTSMATVVSVSDSLAYLEPEAVSAGDVATVGFASSAAAVPGEVLHVLAARPMAFTYDGDHDLDDDLTGVLDGGVVEGTPVVNDDGALVALCSRDGGGIVLVPLPTDPGAGPVSTEDQVVGTDPEPTTATPAPTTIPAPTSSDPSAPGSGTTVPAQRGEAWLGLRLASTPDGQAGVVVHSVQPGSPAAAAGFAHGHRILSIDDRPVQTSADVAAILQQRRPGDTIVVAVVMPTASHGGNGSIPATSSPTSTAAPSSTAAAPTTAAPSSTRPATTVSSVTSVPPTTAAAPAPGPPATATTTAATSTTVPTPQQGTAAPGSTPSTAAITTTVPGGGQATVRITVVLGEREPTV